MNRLAIALSLSVSVAAAIVAVSVLSQRSSGEVREDLSEAPEIRQVRELLASLEERVDTLESTMDRLSSAGSRRVFPSVLSGEPDGARPDGGSGELADTDSKGLEGKLSALAARLDSLEDAENIAQLAQSGRDELLKKRISAALDPFRDPYGDATPDSKLAGLKEIRGFWFTNQGELTAAMKDSELEWKDFYLGMVPLAQDATLDPEFRADVLRNMAGSRDREIRAPLIQLLAFGETPEIRQASIDVLLWHLDDAEVRRALLQAQQDPAEGVRKHIQANLPKVQHFERRAAEEERRRSEQKGSR